jgi:hypothetical protein
MSDSQIINDAGRFVEHLLYLIRDRKLSDRFTRENPSLKLKAFSSIINFLSLILKGGLPPSIDSKTGFSPTYRLEANLLFRIGGVNVALLLQYVKPLLNRIFICNNQSVSLDCIFNAGIYVATHIYLTTFYHSDVCTSEPASGVRFVPTGID